MRNVLLRRINLSSASWAQCYSQLPSSYSIASENNFNANDTSGGFDHEQGALVWRVAPSL
jgi:hypothetical protein